VTTPRQRFGVTSVTGYPIGPQGSLASGRSTRKPTTTWYVLDRAYSHRIVSQHRTARAARSRQRALNRWDRSQP